MTDSSAHHHRDPPRSAARQPPRDRRPRDRTPRAHHRVGRRQHRPADGDWAAHHVSLFGDRALPIAGPGAPLVSEFALIEYAATLNMSTDAANAYVGKTLELRHRLPRLWTHTLTGRLPVWRALRVAEHTCCLPPAAAADVDRALAPVAGTCSWAQLDRLVDEALTRHDPDAAEERSRRAADHRRFDVDTDRVDTSGTVEVHGHLDLADALDLDTALGRTATHLATLGNHRDPRRPPLPRRRRDRPRPARPRPHHRRDRRDPSPAAATVGVWCCTSTSPTPPWPVRWQRRPLRQHPHPRPPRPGKRLVPHRRPGHRRPGQGPRRPPPRRGLRDPRPPQDPGRPPRLTPASSPTAPRRAERCDHDHIDPYAPDGTGGATCTHNIAPLCRRHHRAKTHGRWTYRRLHTTGYEWTTPHGYRIVRDHHGTHPATPPDEP